MNTDLTPNVWDMYRAPRGTFSQSAQFVGKVAETTALIDCLNVNLSIGEGQAMDMLRLAKRVSIETITLS